MHGVGDKPCRGPSACVAHAVRLSGDDRIAQLAVLDVVDVLSDGTLVLNRSFVAECRAKYDADPSLLEYVIKREIVARAREMGVVIDADGLVLAALEVGAPGDARG